MCGRIQTSQTGWRPVVITVSDFHPEVYNDVQKKSKETICSGLIFSTDTLVIHLQVRIGASLVPEVAHVAVGPVVVAANGIDGAGASSHDAVVGQLD